MATERTDLGMTARRLARADVVSVTPDTPITETAQIMRNRTVGSVLVTENDVLVGVVTDRDIAAEVVAANGSSSLTHKDIDLKTLTARDVMTADPQSVDADAKVQRVLRAMNDAHARRIPVVDDNKVVGIIAFDDLVLHLAGECMHVSAQLDSLAEVIHAESPPS
ncbi:CBS domain-containing protein [Haladaptatus litoreus]|uniref:CBS domain-containing protein n=1 Tax=Haladaptatus litoreus TaxID=553468 RepID=A0A1N7CYQ0_9EURY|nr:CBS domain-containing protein [Haladaptatus litoreus]SIR68660.1 CBS domain-containing protein [Haladaptatus litoreus]